MITTVNIIVFILLTLMFVGTEVFVKWEIKSNEVLKTILPAMIFSAILITAWYFLRTS